MSALALQDDSATTDENPTVIMRAARDILSRVRIVEEGGAPDPDPTATAWWHVVKDMCWPARQAGIPIRALDHDDSVVDGRRVFRLRLDVGGQLVSLQMEAAP